MTGPLWRIAAIALGSALCVALFALALTRFEAARLRKDLSDCAAQTQLLQSTIREQNAAVSAMSAESERRVAASERALTLAQGEAAKAQRRALKAMKPLKATGACERLLEADARLLETLR